MTTGPDPTSLEPCPRCSAGVGEPCRSLSGKRTKRIHRERFEAVYPPGSPGEVAEELTPPSRTGGGHV